MRLLQVTPQVPKNDPYVKKNQQLCFEFFQREALQPPSAALLWEAQMLCWLSCGEHKAVQVESLQLYNLRTLLSSTEPDVILRNALLEGGPNALLANIW